MVIYLDLVLLLNFVIDYFILIATSKFLNFSTKQWRMGISAGVGAIYTLTFFLPSKAFFFLFIAKIFLSVLMVLISFGFIHLFQFFRTLATFYFVSFLTGGGVLALQYFFHIEHDVMNGIVVSQSMSPVFLFLFILAAFFLIWFFSDKTFNSLKRKTNHDQKIVDVDIYLNDVLHQCKGLVDTGNRLYDPITRRPVMILEAGEVVFIPQKLKEMHVNGEFQLDLFDQIAKEIDSIWLSRIHIVPFRSLVKDTQFILAIRPDQVIIHTKEEQFFKHTKVLIGLDYGRLSHDQTFQAIIHPELLAG